MFRPDLLTPTRWYTVLHDKVSYYFLVVLSPALASPFVVYHHATELALMFAGLLPHDGSARGGGAAGHGCCSGQTSKNHGRQGKVRLRGVRGKIKNK